MFPEKYVRVFPETRTRICENTYVFSQILVRVSGKTRTYFSGNIINFLSV